MGQRQSIGFIGGTFNPIHNGHLLLAEEARVQFELDQVLFIPNNIPPHRGASEDLVDAETRYLMTVLATASHPNFFVSTIEIKRQGPSYTRDTVAELKTKNPESDFYFVGGTDCLLQHAWHRFGEILKLLDGFLLAPRDEGAFEAARKKVAETAPEHLSKVRKIEMPRVDISATEIRKRLRRGKSVHYLVPEAVEQFIRHHHLYSEVYQL